MFSALEIFLVMRYINLLFTYFLLTYTINVLQYCCIWPAHRQFYHRAWYAIYSSGSPRKEASERFICVVMCYVQQI